MGCWQPAAFPAASQEPGLETTALKERAHGIHLKRHGTPPPSVRKLVLPIKINVTSWHRQQDMPGGLGRLPSASLTSGTVCSGTGPMGLTPPVGTDERHHGVVLQCSREPTATPWRARHPRNTDTDSPAKMLSPSHLPLQAPRPPGWPAGQGSHLPALVPSLPRALGSGALDSHRPPCCQPHAESSLCCICPRRHFPPGTSSRILQGVRYLHVFWSLQLA